MTSGERWPLEAGVLYVVGPNDRHRFLVTEDEHHLSIFCPPLRGDERFDQDGGYEASGPDREDRSAHVRQTRGRDAPGREGDDRGQRPGAHDPHADQGRRPRLRILGRALCRGRRGHPLVQASLGSEPHHFRHRRGDRPHHRPDLEARTQHGLQRGTQGPAPPARPYRHSSCERVLPAARGQRAARQGRSACCRADLSRQARRAIEE